MPYNDDIEHALISFASTFAPYDVQPLTSIAQFSSGMVFAHLLSTVQHFNLSLKELERQSDKWIQRLTNLKRILAKIDAYIGDGGKSIKTKDIDLIEIAKHDSTENILRFFELVIAVFMQSPHKEEYIQTIMKLDERSQQALVVIVQNAIDERIADPSQNNHNAKMVEHLQQLTSENELLRQEMQELSNGNQKYKREVLELRERLEEFEFTDQKTRKQVMDSSDQHLRTELEQLRSMNDNLRQKLLMSVRQHEEELSRIRQENIILQKEMSRFKEYEEAVQHLKEQLSEAQGDRERNSQTQREKRRMSRLIEEKDSIINKLKQKIQEINQKNYSMQQHELCMKIELQKKQVRFKQLQKQVKSRLKSQPYTPNQPVIPVATPLDQEQMDYLQEQLDKLRNNYRELQRQNLKLKKKLEKTVSLQGEKKKLQKIILDVSKSKDAEIQMLLVSLYDLRSENIKIHDLLIKKT